LAGVTVGGWAVAARGAGDPAAAKGRALVAWFGADSKITAPTTVRVDTAEEWAQLWERHTGRPVAPGERRRPTSPDVDFGACTVVGVFEGEGWNGDGLVCAEWRADGDVVRVRCDRLSYQTGGPDGGGVKVTVYGLFVLPKTDKPIVVEERLPTKGEPEKDRWGEVARLKAK
jgi:hypothetical protein